MNITIQELDLLNKCNTKEEQNKTCNQIKRNHNGNYPDDWFKSVILAGLLPNLKIEITSYKRS